ncbi:MAG: hypothetical protein RR275_07700 [Lachnospiraceae bacterium]
MRSIRYQYADADWRFSQKVVRYWTEKVLQEGMKLGSSMLNINIPEGCLEVSNYRYTRQSKQNFFDFRKPPRRELREPYEMPSVVNYKIEDLETDSDIYVSCVEQRISVTPMCHDLTVRGL